MLKDSQAFQTSKNNYAVIIGVSKYDEPSVFVPINSCNKDLAEFSQFFEDVNAAGMFFFKRIFTSFNDDQNEVQRVLKTVEEEVNRDEGPSTVFLFYSGSGHLIQNKLHAVFRNGNKINLEDFAVKCT
jgi:hypothetical protein